jgi:GDPmannose 4,6-dehydratase
MIFLIIEISGQTAAYVTKELLNRGFNVSGTSRDIRRTNLASLSKVGVNFDRLDLLSLDPADPRQVFSLLASTKFDAIINLAGQTSVSLSFEQPAQALDSISTS